MYSLSPGTAEIVKTEGYQKAISHSSRREYELNSIVKRELGDISGKKLLHLQCNTGADSILLARMGAEATGVDLVPENVHFAGRLAQELGVDDVSFVISDIMELMDTHEGKYGHRRLCIRNKGMQELLLDVYHRRFSQFTGEGGSDH